MRAHRFRSGSRLAILAVALLTVACTAQPGILPTSSPLSGKPSPPIGSAASASPSVSSIATPEASASDEPSSPPVATPADTPMAEPPAASLAVDGGDPVAGELGSFTWNNAGSDAPWIPGNPMDIGPGEQLTLALASSVAVDQWTVARTPGATFGSNIVGMGDGTGAPVTFAAPPRGVWSVSVNVWFADNLGSASYYWLITVK